MGKFIETILDNYRDIIEKNIDSLAFNDRVYKRDCNSRDDLEERFFSIKFNKEEMFIEDYIACIQTTDERRAHLVSDSEFSFLSPAQILQIKIEHSK